MSDTIKQWMTAAAVRAVKTAAQTAIAVIGTSTAMGEVNWALVGSSALLAAVLSVLTSLTGIPEANDGTSPLLGGEATDESEA